MARTQTIIMYTGAFLVIVGVGLIVAQICLQVVAPEVSFPSRSLNIEGAGAKTSVQTTYVGLILVVIGAVLEVIGYLADKPWKTRQTD